MGASSSKNAAKAAQVGARKYPTHTSQPQSITNKPPTRLPSDGTHGPQVHPRTTYSDTRDNSVNSDASDPDFSSMPHSQFSSRLRQIGPVQPSPTLSHHTHPPSSSQIPNSMFPSGADAYTPEQIKLNPTLLVLQSRKRINQEASEEFEQAARRGGEVRRRFLDVGLLRTTLGMLEEGRYSPAEIEKRLGLENGLIATLGKGVFSASSHPAPDAGRLA